MLIAIVGKSGCGKTTFRKKLLTSVIPDYNTSLKSHVMHQNWNWNYQTRRIVKYITLIDRNLTIECADTSYIPQEIWPSIDYWVFLDGYVAEEYFKRSCKLTPEINHTIDETFGVCIQIGDGSDGEGEWECKCSYKYPCMIYNNKNSTIFKMYDCTILE
jgi:ABC-type dipeptide/oligopeptide/nickel transport system ATPase component